MDMRTAGQRSRARYLVEPILLLALAACSLFLPSCKEDAPPQQAPAGVSASTPPSGGCAAITPSDRSPKELALAAFLSSMKLENKVVLIEFGMVGCELSGQGLDNMIALQTAGTVPGLAFVRAEVSPDDVAVASYFKEKGPAFPVYRDQEAALARSLSATAWPTFLLVDKFGHIRYQGSYPKEDLVQWAGTLVAESHDAGGDARQFGAREIRTEELLADKLPDLHDQLRPLNDYMGGGGLVLLFADTSCPFSAIALREMPAVSASLARQGVNAVVLNAGEAASRVRDFYVRNDPGVPVVYDVGTTARERWNVHSVPVLVYITPAGEVGYQGEAVWANLGTAIENALSLARGSITFTAAGTGFG